MGFWYAVGDYFLGFDIHRTHVHDRSMTREFSTGDISQDLKRSYSHEFAALMASKIMPNLATGLSLGVMAYRQDLSMLRVLAISEAVRLIFHLHNRGRRAEIRDHHRWLVDRQGLEDEVENPE